MSTTDTTVTGINGRWEYKANAGSVIRLMRECMRMSRQDLAAEVGISVSQLGRIERGERTVYDFEPVYWRIIKVLAGTLVPARQGVRDVA